MGCIVSLSLSKVRAAHFRAASASFKVDITLDTLTSLIVIVLVLPGAREFFGSTDRPALDLPKHIFRSDFFRFLAIPGRQLTAMRERHAAGRETAGGDRPPLSNLFISAQNVVDGSVAVNGAAAGTFGCLGSICHERLLASTDSQFILLLASRTGETLAIMTGEEALAVIPYAVIRSKLPQSEQVC